MADNKHKNYHTLNFIGYGLAKFGMDLVNNLGFTTKQSFYSSMVELGVADTVGTVKNRQDLFDPFFENNRAGWWQKGNAYIHRKTFIDSLFGDLSAGAYANVLSIHLRSEFVDKKEPKIPPIIKSKYKQLQNTGREAEQYFMDRYKTIDIFSEGILEDARLFGDGYDFQIQVESNYYLAEVKGVKGRSGNIRLTSNEFKKAMEYEEFYVISVISDLFLEPKINLVFDPARKLKLTINTAEYKQTTYHSANINWANYS